VIDGPQGRIYTANQNAPAFSLHGNGRSPRRTHLPFQLLEGIGRVALKHVFELSETTAPMPQAR
jgi:hypothetical protein